jgi:hypothetical protein
VLRRPDEDGHLVEGNPLLRTSQDAPCDLDALTPLTGCGEELERSVQLTRQRPGLGVEEKPSQMRQIVQALIIVSVDVCTNGTQQIDRGLVARR